MLNPQSKTKTDRCLSNFISAFRAAPWIAAAFDVFERCAEVRFKVDLSRTFPLSMLRNYGQLHAISELLLLVQMALT
jgi:hypothetical protein